MQKYLIIGSIILIVVLFTVYFGANCGIQRRAMYPSPPAPPGEPQLPRGTEVVWLGPDANVEAWFMRPFGIENLFPVVIFTHGNGELIDYWIRPFSQLLSSGVGVMLVEYPGYGRSGGSPSQKSITQIMLAAYDFVVAQSGVDSDAIVAHGRSLGGGAACALAIERPLSALVLESSFTSVREMAARFGFPSAMIVDKFENLEAVASLDIPVLVIHGERDQMIPVAHGEELADAAETELVRLPCGHDDCPFAWPIVESFMSEQGLLRH
jgi:hypothetical protein